jgi:predicted phosphodiesterase
MKNKRMKIIITSDIHEYYTQTLEKINSVKDVDYVFITGDITNNGLYSVRYFEDFYNPVNREGEFIDFMTNIKHQTYWITGNHDTHLHSYNLESDDFTIKFICFLSICYI